jgi:TonB-dependent starch-binding outer membrane protein SusC
MNLKTNATPLRLRQKVALMALMLTLSFMATAQTRKVTGMVKDSVGAPVPSTSISIKGKSVIGLTDANGRFAIEVPNNSVIVFSAVNYQPHETKIEKGGDINIILRTKAAALEDVVVIGYGSSKRSDVTGAIAKAPVAEMTLAPVKSIDEALQGRVAGVVVSSNDGQPGSSPNITIRGNNSISQNNSPLYVVDGFPLEDNSFNDINPNDIESIELLKDASATAIYGARGANGVIMVTTKKGKTGAPVINFNAYIGQQNILKTMELMSPYDFIRYQHERDSLGNSYFSSISPNLGYVTDSIYLRKQPLESYKNVRGVDFQKQLFRPAMLSSYDISIRGGNQQTRYSISGSIFNQQGIMINSGYKRYQGRISIDQTVNRYVKIGINANYTNNLLRGQTPTYISDGNPQSNLNVLSTVWSYRPVSPLDASGKQLVDLEEEMMDPSLNATTDYRINPIINQRQTINNNTQNNLIVNGYAEFKILPSLTLRITGGITSNLNRNDQFNDSNTVRGSVRTNFGASNGVNGAVLYSHNNTWVNENILTFNKVLAKHHSLNAVGVFSSQGNKSFFNGLQANFLPNPGLGLSGLDEGTPIAVKAASSNWSLASFTGRLAYDYAKKYYATVTYRADGSSKFSPSNKWAYFPSASAKWKFTEEKWMKNNKFLTDGNLRASWGLTGNNRVNDFSYLSGLIIGYGYQTGYVFNNTVMQSAIPNGLANPTLKWETTTQSDIGLDLAFFKDRIKVTTDVYRKTTSDLLLNAAIPTSLGYSNVFKNVGKVENQGLELGIGTLNVTGKNFSWSTDFNIAWNSSKVLELSQNQEAITNGVPFDRFYKPLPAYISKIGQPMGQIYGLLWAGVYQYSDFNYNTVINTSAANAGRGSHWVLKDDVPTNGSARASIQPGDIKYVDLNGDGVINSSDYTVIGRGLPIHTGGINNRFTYKDFDLSVFLQWSYGNDIQNANDLLLNGNGNNANFFNQFAKYNDRWTPDNQSSTLFRTGGFGPLAYSSRTVEDGSYLRLKTLSFGYNFSKTLLRKTGLKGCRIYGAAQNLITWTKYSGMDPEISTYNSVLTPGFDFSGYPRASTVTFGANITF